MDKKIYVDEIIEYIDQHIVEIDGINYIEVIPFKSFMNGTNQPLKVENPEWCFTFGRYKFHSIKEVLDENPSYILWVDEKVDFIELSAKIVMDAYNRVNKQEVIQRTEELETEYYFDSDDDHSYIDLDEEDMATVFGEYDRIY